MELGRIGLWAQPFRTAPRDQAKQALSVVEGLGYGALWIPGGGTGEILDVVSDLLDTSERIVLATGILNIWMHTPEDTARQHRELTSAHPGRFLLGLGVSHASIVESSTPLPYRQPMKVMSSFLDGLDAAESPVPQDERVLAALGPKMLQLSDQRAAGAHPYCVPVEHTRVAREVLGSGPLLAPEVKVVLEEDPATARGIARAHLERYLRQPNYVNNLLRLGYDQKDLADGGTDQVVDDLVGWGSVATVADRVNAHLEAGADHVCIQVLTEDLTAFSEPQWRALAEVLL